MSNAPQSGVPGVAWNAARGKWQARIAVRGKDTYLGLFNDLGEAIAAREAAVAKLDGELRARIEKGERISSFEVEVFRKTMRGLLAADHPQSVRHVFYLMTNPRLPFHVEKSERGYRQVQNQLAEMRKLGIIPYGWIADATRMGVARFDLPQPRRLHPQDEGLLSRRHLEGRRRLLRGVGRIALDLQRDPRRLRRAWREPLSFWGVLIPDLALRGRRRDRRRDQGHLEDHRDRLHRRLGSGWRSDRQGH
jgi:hypothetical protein